MIWGGYQITIWEGLDQDTAVTALTMLESATTVATQAISSVWGAITGNALLQFYVGVSILFVGVGLFRKIKRAARN